MQPTSPPDPDEQESLRELTWRRLEADGFPLPSYVGAGSVRETVKRVIGTFIALIVMFGILALVLTIISR